MENPFKIGDKVRLTVTGKLGWETQDWASKEGITADKELVVFLVDNNWLKFKGYTCCHNWKKFVLQEEKWKIGGWVRLLRDYDRAKKGDYAQITGKINDPLLIVDYNGSKLGSGLYNGLDGHTVECEWVGMIKPSEEPKNTFTEKCLFCIENHGEEQRLKINHLYKVISIDKFDCYRIEGLPSSYHKSRFSEFPKPTIGHLDVGKRVRLVRTPVEQDWKGIGIGENPPVFGRIRSVESHSSILFIALKDEPFFYPAHCYELVEESVVQTPVIEPKRNLIECEVYNVVSTEQTVMEKYGQKPQIISRKRVPKIKHI